MKFKQYKMPTLLKNLTTFSLLLLLTISAFFIRLENVKNTQLRSIDEIVYYRMGQQIVEEGLSGYNTIPYGNEMAAAGRDLPKYFFQPLFKHPPVFTFLVALSMKIFGVNIISASYVSLLLGALMIPLVYFLGKLVFNHTVGILSAIFLWMDPVSIICSQKIWMETTIGFFTLFSITCFAYGMLNPKKNSPFILAGIASGLATLTKYTGILPTFSFIAFAFLYQPKLFKNKKFLCSLFIPLIMLIPWFIWNLAVYQTQTFDIIFNKVNPHFSSLLQKLHLSLIIPIAILFMALSLLYKKLTMHSVQKVLKNSDYDQTTKSNLLKPILMVMFTGTLLFILREQIIFGFRFDYLPKVSWGNFGFRDDNLPFFYFTQLAKFSMIYIPAFLSLFLGNKNKNDSQALIRFSTILILSFFIFWRNYQSRYIIQAIPLLLILSSHFLHKVFCMISLKENFILRTTYKASLMLFITFALLKTYYINLVLSYPHDFCYF